MIGLDDFFKISDDTTSVIKCDGNLVITNVFCFGHVQHELNQWGYFTKLMQVRRFPQVLSSA